MENIELNRFVARVNGIRAEAIAKRESGLISEQGYNACIAALAALCEERVRLHARLYAELSQLKAPPHKMWGAYASPGRDRSATGQLRWAKKYKIDEVSEMIHSSHSSAIFFKPFPFQYLPHFPGSHPARPDPKVVSEPRAWANDRAYQRAAKELMERRKQRQLTEIGFERKKAMEAEAQHKEADAQRKAKKHQLAQEIGLAA